jgi:N-acetylmuramoyl-L-alanine amidase
MALEIRWIGSKHKNKGRGGFRPEAVVIHVMEGTLVGTDSWFNNPASKVSAHYGVGRDGTIHQYVSETDTAFHAGRRSKPTWGMIKDGINPNLYTIGIEHEGDGGSAWPPAMYEATTALIRDICMRWSIPIDRDHIIGHREIYSAKTCPGSAVSLEKIIKLTRPEALNAGNYNFIPHPGVVKALGDLNLRKGAPTTAAKKVKTVAAGTGLAYIGWTSNGQTVSGNSHWYRDAEGNYFWAGGTQQPTPGL